MRNWTPVMRGRRQRRGRVSDREYLRKDKKRDCVRGKGISWKRDTGEKRSAQKKNTRPGRYASELMLSSAPSGTRTLDTLIKSQVLYQLS